MSDDAPEQRLQPGTRLIVHDSHGTPFDVVVESVEEGTIQVDCSGASVASGQPVLIEHRVPGDARYRVRAQVDVDPEQGVRLHPVEGWERDNQRSYVRVRTYGLEAAVACPLQELGREAGPRAPAKRAAYPMLDVSAGGAAIRAEPRFELGDELVCHFELPGESDFELSARVVRIDAPPGSHSRCTIGLEFLDPEEDDRAALLRWVYREQTRRRNTR